MPVKKVILTFCKIKYGLRLLLLNKELIKFYIYIVCVCVYVYISSVWSKSMLIQFEKCFHCVS